MRIVQRIMLGAVVLAVAAGTHYGIAQTGTASAPTVHPSDYYSIEKLREIGAQMLVKAKASPDGSAGMTIETYPGHFINVNARANINGLGEVHQHLNDVFVVLDGEATEITGGTIPDIKFDAAGEEGRGQKIVGGTPHLLKTGDVIHITAGTPHQTLIHPGKTFIYLVVKVHQD